MYCHAHKGQLVHTNNRRSCNQLVPLNDRRNENTVILDNWKGHKPKNYKFSRGINFLAYKICDPISITMRSKTISNLYKIYNSIIAVRGRAGKSIWPVQGHHGSNKDAKARQRTK